MFLFKLTDLKRVRSNGYELGRSTTTNSSQNRFGGKILKISFDGKLLQVFEIFSGDGTTNVAFSEREKELYVTMVKDPKDPQAKGSIVRSQT